MPVEPLRLGEVRLPKRILVTGGNGFVGSYLVPALHACYPDARLFLAGRGADGPAEVAADLLDTASIRRVIEQTSPDLVCHLAGEASVSAASRAAADTWRLNVIGTLELGAALSESSPDATFFFVSSAEVYGDALRHQTVTEATPPEPTSVYGRSKLAAELALHNVLSVNNRLIVVRPTNHLGPGQSSRFAIASFAKQLVEAEAHADEIALKVGNLSAERDFMDVRDVVASYISLMSYPFSLGCRETFNIASGHLQSVGAMLDRLREQSTSSTRLEVEHARIRADEIPRAAVDGSRVAALTGWQPRITLDGTISDVLASARIACNH